MAVDMAGDTSKDTSVTTSVTTSERPATEGRSVSRAKPAYAEAN
jgi:hypothetical protein